MKRLPARLARFELATPGFVGRCSIQMSYSRVFGATRMPREQARVKGIDQIQEPWKGSRASRDGLRRGKPGSVHA